MAASGRILLALETATAHASVAVLDELGALQGEVTFRAQRTMSQRLAPAIGHLMADLDLGRTTSAGSRSGSDRARSPACGSGWPGPKASRCGVR